MTDTFSEPQALRWTTRMALVLMVLSLAGCATTNPRDPLEPMNRKIFGFNEAVDQVLIKPVAAGYAAVVPTFVQTGVGNVIKNIKDVWSAANLFLQGRPGEGAQEILRVGINSTLGLGGLLDIATPMQMERHNEDLGQTFGVWGVPSGAYLVLPLFGPSTVRDAVALPADNYFSPTLLFQQVPDINAVRVLTVVHTRAQLLDATALMSDVALDKYAFVRDAYLQRRRNLIYNGEPPDEFSLRDDEPSFLPAVQTVALADTLPLGEAAPLTEPAKEVLGAPIVAPTEPASAELPKAVQAVQPIQAVLVVSEESLSRLLNPIELR
jgi:phospholipid-binding lipoprotein MlaA